MKKIKKILFILVFSIFLFGFTSNVSATDTIDSSTTYYPSGDIVELKIGNGYGGVAWFDSTTGVSNVASLTVGSQKSYYAKLTYWPENNIFGEITLKINMCTTSSSNDIRRANINDDLYMFSDTFSYKSMIDSRQKCKINGVDGTVFSIYFNFNALSGESHGDFTYVTFNFATYNPVNYAIYEKIVSYELISSNETIGGDINNTLTEANIINAEAQETRKSILDNIKSLVTGITNLPSLIWNAIKGGFEAITNGLTNLLNFIKTLPGLIWDAIKGGFEAITSGLTSLGNLLKTAVENLGTFLINGIKGLFVPTDEQLYEIINDASKLSENFGFVGQSVSFFINIFTALLGMVNANGCIELPELTIGGIHGMFDKFTFWEAQQVCLNDNVILSANIDKIRTITSIALVCLFINFAASKFFSILSKGDNDSVVVDSKTGEVLS